MPTLSPEEIQDKMARCLSRLEICHAEMKKLQKDKTIREQKAKLVIYAKRTDLITNDKLKSHLESIKEDKKITSWTADMVKAAIYIECQDIMEPYNLAKEESENIKAEQDVLKTMIMEYQSKRKFQGIELETFGK